MAEVRDFQTPFPLESSNLSHFHGIIYKNRPWTPPPKKQNFPSDPPGNFFWIH